MPGPTPVLLVKYGEICLRGANRPQFERKLLDHVRERLKDIGGLSIQKELSRIYVEGGAEQLAAALPRVLKIPGVIGVSQGVKLEQYDLEAVLECASDFLRGIAGEAPFTFKADTKRANKRFPMKSQEVSAEVGARVLADMPNAKVDVHNPEILLQIELRTYAYIYAGTRKAVGGLPTGSSGRGMLLLSGGIDSPVAGCLMAKRGVDLCAAYFHSPPYTSERARDKVIDLAKQVSTYSGRLRLFIVPFTEAQLFLKKTVQAEKLTIMLKRAMLRAAQTLANAEGCQCLVTGDSVGQVASQTMHSLLAVESAVSLPILRPLSGMDKQEITELALLYDTYDISIRPYEDCCTIFVAEHPETKPKASVIEGIEKKLTELDGMLEK
ncbi:MAG: tRNA 4-thiouridine(8) synthase ThiI, partial [Defluviitaleaceae bacterium]|nr:tRNA 4-thiouridine(8) synthase ThiI [Defluviitaleaceae bacterium]